MNKTNKNLFAGASIGELFMRALATGFAAHVGEFDAANAPADDAAPKRGRKAMKRGGRKPGPKKGAKRAGRKPGPKPGKKRAAGKRGKPGPKPGAKAKARKTVRKAVSKAKAKPARKAAAKRAKKSAGAVAAE